MTCQGNRPDPPEGFKRYPMVVDPSGRLHNPPSCSVLYVWADEESDFRAQLAESADPMEKVLKDFHAQPLSGDADVLLHGRMFRERIDAALAVATALAPGAFTHDDWLTLVNQMVRALTGSGLGNDPMTTQEYRSLQMVREDADDEEETAAELYGDGTG